MRPHRTPTVLQMEATECGAASLGAVMAYHGTWVPLEELRLECGVSRDGSKASNVVKAARKYGFEAKGFKKEPEKLREEVPLPAIIHWNFNHFVVLEGFDGDRVYINDPASGPRALSIEELDQSFTGVVLTFEKSEDWTPRGAPPRVWPALVDRLSGSRAAVAFVLLAGLLLVVPGLVIPTFSRIFVDDVLVANKAAWLKPLLVGIAVTALLRGCLTWLRERYLLRLAMKLAISMSSRFVWHVLRLPMSFFSARYAGDITSRIQLNDRLASLLSGELASAILDLVMVVFYAALMFWYDVTLTLIGIGFAILNLLALRFASRSRVTISQVLLQERGKLIGVSMGGLQLIETLKAGGGESDFFAKWGGHYAKVINAEQRLGVSSSLLGVVPTTLTLLNTIVILGVGSVRVMDGVLTMGMLVAFQSLMASFTGPIERLVGLGSTLQEVEGDLRRLDDVLDQPGVVVDEEVGGAARIAGRVTVDDVTFGYSPREKPLIEDFALEVKPGSRVALVGGSGSGKSTVAKLVTGLYEPWSGAVRFDGAVRRELPRRVITEAVAMVDQEIFLFEGSVRDNLTLWDPTVPDADVVRAAKDACIHEDIASLARGYDAHLEEGGRNLSGGQRQRLEIARALVQNPSVLVLDEATSALDPETEGRVDDNLRKRGCTCLIVAHRLSTIRDCDEIVVMERGRIVERGTHDELMEKDGRYKRLIAAA